MLRVKQTVKQNELNGQKKTTRRMKTEARFGAGDGIRTRDVLLGRQALYH